MNLTRRGSTIQMDDLTTTESCPPARPRRPAAPRRRLPVQQNNLFLLLLSILLLVVASPYQLYCHAFFPPVHVQRAHAALSSNHLEENSNARHINQRSRLTSSRLSFRFVPTDEVAGDQEESGVPSKPPPPHKIDPTVDGEGTTVASRDPLAGSQTVHLSLWPHVPLGCVVEECLATYDKVDDDQSHPSPVYVFVSAVKSGGNADKAGLKVGDVLLECTDLFGQLTDATHLGVEKVKGLVKSRPDDEPLVFKVARGSRILDDHEMALVELCRNPDGGIGADEELMEQCVTAFVQSTYDDFDDVKDHLVTIECPVVGDAVGTDSVDCLVDSMYSMWAEDTGVNNGPTKSSGAAAAAAANSDDSQSSSVKNKSVKPWSSRSSPSGTYVRDPTTGKLKNIDS